MRGMKRFARPMLALLPVAVAVAVGASFTSAANDNARKAPLEFLGEQIIPTGTSTGHADRRSLGHGDDSDRSVFYALSDDQGQIDPARFYKLRIDLADGASTPATSTSSASRRCSSRTASLSRRRASTRRPRAHEGRRARRHLGGLRDQLIDPSSASSSSTARRLGDLPVPAPFLPNAGGTRGVRQNLGFESAAIAPNGRFLFTGTEAALAQDGPPSTLAGGSPARLLRYNLQTGRLDRSTSTGPRRSPSRPCRRRTSRSTGSSSCSRSTTSS